MPKPTSASPPISMLPVTDIAVMRVKGWLLQERSPSDSFHLFGLELPRKTGEIRSGALHVLCTAPGEWLVISAKANWSVREAGLHPELQQQGLSGVEVSDGMLVIDLDGRATCDVLSKGCGLDFDIGRFEPHTCASTRFAEIPVLIERLDAVLRFRVYVSRSYGPYLRAWLADAAEEFTGSQAGLACDRF